MNASTSSATRSGRGLATRLRFWLGDAYRGAGRPAPKETLDEQYRAGGWKRLDTLQQMIPCSIAAGYVHGLFEAPRVLDVGCGHGRLARLLSRFPLQRYVGVDLSSEAVDQARALDIDEAEFLAADFDSFTPPGTFDCIVFLDSLYYAADPLATLLRYSTALDVDGVFVVSMYRYSNNGLILRRLGSRFRTVDETDVRNGGKRWSVQVLRPRNGGG